MPHIEGGRHREQRRSDSEVARMDALFAALRDGVPPEEALIRADQREAEIKAAKRPLGSISFNSTKTR